MEGEVRGPKGDCRGGERNSIEGLRGKYGCGAGGGGG